MLLLLACYCLAWLFTYCSLTWLLPTCCSRSFFFACCSLAWLPTCFVAPCYYSFMWLLFIYCFPTWLPICYSHAWLFLRVAPCPWSLLPPMATPPRCFMSLLLTCCSLFFKVPLARPYYCCSPPYVVAPRMCFPRWYSPPPHPPTFFLGSLWNYNQQTR